MDISVIIVSYNTQVLTLQCIASLYAHTAGVRFEVIMVDNASSDDTVARVQARFPAVKIIVNSHNVGFGAANNQGVRVAAGKYLFLFNSDAFLTNNALLHFFYYMEKKAAPACAACGGLLMFDAGGRKENVSAGHFPSFWQDFADIGFSHLYPAYYGRRLSIGIGKQASSVYPVDYLSGADIFIRREVFRQVGGFDETFFLYYEETDLFFRLKKAGYTAVVLPDVNLVHLGGGSSGSRGKNPRKERILFGSKLHFYRKSYGLRAARRMKVLTALQCLVRPWAYGKDWGSFLCFIFKA